MSDIRPIRRLAIVNRGEAAMRCIRAVKSLGAQQGEAIQIVALFTEVDRSAPFVRHADITVQLPIPSGATAVQPYLDHDLLISTLQRHRVDAVWPGWGFVAEDASFVDRCAAANIRFLGPSADTMRALGDKISSKELAERADVPVTRWSGGEVKSPDEAERHVSHIGYPLVIKASAGGGGRGIRMVRQPEQLTQAFESAASEAKNAFGDGRLFMEAMVQGGRHIEVQIVADEHGTVIAFGTRDCSVQRRHQKVIEEGPPTNMAPLLLKAIKDSAVELARSVGYTGVGTVEFLVCGSEYYFLEINPRLQVEHGITERLTGADLVQLQIRIAQGERLPDASEIRERGFAIEARVCAEDPDAGFLPAPGRIARFDPALGPRLRVDTGVASDSVVPPDFDSLIAKVIAYGDTREEARARLVTALRDFDVVIEGGSTNKGYLIEVLEDAEYRQGGVDTLWLDRWNEQRDDHVRPFAGEALVLAAILAYQTNRIILRRNFYADPSNITLERIPQSCGQEIDLSHAGKSYRVRVFAAGSWQYRVHLDGHAVGVGYNGSGSHAARMVIGGQDLRVLHDVSDSNIRVEIEGHVHRFGRQTAGQVRASAPSLVVSINVDVGDRVDAGQQLGLVEAMKMEIGFDAPVGGVVTEVRARKGQQLAAGEVILVIDPATASDGAAETSRIQLPSEVDPLAVLFTEGIDGGLGQPDLERLAKANRAERAAAMEAVAEEIRRVLLGYDAFDERVNKLVEFLSAPIPESLGAELHAELVGVKRMLGVLADVERVFMRRQLTDEEGALGASNNARLRLYIRRMRAEGSGLPASFLSDLKKALSHYNVHSLEHAVRLERSVMRLFAAQLEPALRFRLVRAVLGRVMALVDLGIDLEHDADLRLALNDIAAMRGQVPDALADAVIQAHHTIFVRPELNRQAERTTSSVERWLERSDTALEHQVLLDLALAPAGMFRKVKRWLRDGDRRRRSIALSACIIRNYAPKTPVRYATELFDEFPIDRMELADGHTVLAALCPSGSEREAVLSMIESAGQEPVSAFELVVPVDNQEQQEQALELARNACMRGIPADRFTLSLLDSDLRARHHTFRLASDGHVEKLPLYGLHPESAVRVDFRRYQSFELERLPSPEGIYCFYGKAREVPEDERVFVLIDVRGKPPEGGPNAAHYVPLVERAFNEATRTLRHILTRRDPRRQLQWNRITLFLAHPVLLDEKSVDLLSHKLHPTTRHLGLERVAVRLKLLESHEGSAEVREVELVISDLTGSSMELVWREPHKSPLVPVETYQRSVVSAKRRGLVYPYEIVRMLAPQDSPAVSRRNRDVGLPLGHFEEYDLDPDFSAPRAVSVAGRSPGQNKAAIVFGIITTPTRKVPEGMKRVLVLSDPTKGMGALSSGECDRVVAAIDLAEKLGVPVEWVPVSSGARISMNSGTENLDATARVVRRIVTFTQSGGVIHLIVGGVNVGAQSYWDALSTMLLHTKGILIMTPRASMVLTGRAALAASGSVSAEDEVGIGGFERIMGPNGQAQYLAQDLSEAFRILYEHYDFTYVVPGEEGPRRLATTDPPNRLVTQSAYVGEGFETVGEIFDPSTNPGRKKPFAMRALMSVVIDQDGGYLERWKTQVGAETVIVWDAHLGGQPVCLLGVESQNVPRWGYRPLDGPAEYNGGTLFPQSSRKVARALNSASGNRPAVILANLSGFDGSPESMRKLQLEHGAEIARAVVNFDGPILFLVVSRYHGGAYVVFSRELNPSLRALAIEGSYASVIGGGPAAKVVFSREVRARVQSDVRVQAALELLKENPGPEGREALERLRQDVLLEKQAEVAAEFDAVHTVQRARDVGSLEAIIEATEMREFLIRSLGVESRRAAE